MLKNILNLEGVQVLNKIQQKTIFGGTPPSFDDGKCTKKTCSLNSDCGTGGVCAQYSPPCSAWGDCGCGKYCL